MGLLSRRNHSPALLELLIAIGANFPALSIARAQSQAGRWSQRSLRVQMLLTDLTYHVAAIESDYRGYVLTRNPTMRQNMLRTVPEIEPHRARLTA